MFDSIREAVYHAATLPAADRRKKHMQFVNQWHPDLNASSEATAAFKLLVETIEKFKRRAAQDPEQQQEQQQEQLQEQQQEQQQEQ